MDARTRQRIMALERKALDRAVSAPERDALLAKVAELKAKHGEPTTVPPAPRSRIFNSGDLFTFTANRFVEPDGGLIRIVNRNGRRLTIRRVR